MTKIYTKEELINLPLYKLRIILRDIGGVPGNKTVKEVVEEILDIQSGKKVPTPTKRGRKPKTASEESEIAYNDGGSVDLTVPVEPPSDDKRPRGEGFSVDYKFTSGYEHGYEYSKDGVQAPLRTQVCDVEGEEPLRMIVASGVLEILADGYGFLRKINYGEKRLDVYVDKQMIKTYALKTGDYIVGHAINKYQRTSFNMCEVEKINGIVREAFVRGIDFENGTAIYPYQNLISITEEDKTLRAIDLIAPIGKGQRALIVAPPKTGKTTLLKKLADRISRTNADVHVIVLLIDERPEEVTDFDQRLYGCEIIASTFDQSPSHHVFHAELALERAKRLAECGKDVVLLLDSITKLARTYNVATPSSGKTLSGGIEADALVKAKKIFGAARKLREGGSLTIVATALVETGSRMDEVIFEEFKGTGNMEIVLSKELAQKQVFPAIDILKSGTRKSELLTSEYKLKALAEIVALFEIRTNVMQTLIEMLNRSSNNEDFIRKFDSWIKAIRD